MGHEPPRAASEGRRHRFPCPGCGASLEFAPQHGSLACPYCGREEPIPATVKEVRERSFEAYHKVRPERLQEAAAKPWLAPESLLPFGNTRHEAADSVRAWLASRWFAPNALRRLGRPEAIQGVCLPLWTYDAHATGHYTGLRGEHYLESETYTARDAQGRDETRRRDVRKTRWFPVAGTVARWFDDVLVAATRSPSQDRLDALEP